MRKILFRGKREDSGEWIFGAFIPDLIGWGFIKPFGKAKKDLHMQYVDRETVGQYTGLTDKNGVKIFEGDIVEFFGMCGQIVQECGAFGIAVIPYINYDLLESKIPFKNNANFCFNDNFVSLWELWWNYEQDDNPLYEVEVIGNIHENPELLETSA